MADNKHCPECGEELLTVKDLETNVDGVEEQYQFDCAFCGKSGTVTVDESEEEEEQESEEDESSE